MSEDEVSASVAPPNTHSETPVPIIRPQVDRSTRTSQPTTGGLQILYFALLETVNKVSMASQTFYIGSLGALGLLIVCTAQLTSYERSFTPYSKNLSCYICEPGSMNLTNRTYVQWEIENKQCEEPTDDLIQQCEETEVFKPRGCGKLVTKSYQQINFGGEREVKLVRRFCASSGMNPEEQRCIQTMSQGRWTEVCVCGGDLCNGVGRTITSLFSALSLLLHLLLV